MLIEIALSASSPGTSSDLEVVAEHEHRRAADDLHVLEPELLEVVQRLLAAHADADPDLSMIAPMNALTDSSWVGSHPGSVGKARLEPAAKQDHRDLELPDDRDRRSRPCMKLSAEAVRERDDVDVELVVDVVRARALGLEPSGSIVTSLVSR